MQDEFDDLDKKSDISDEVSEPEDVITNRSMEIESESLSNEPLLDGETDGKDKETLGEELPSENPDEEDEPSKVVIRRLKTETSEKKKESSNKDKGFLYSVLDTLRFICLGLVIGIALVIFVVQRNDVYGDSMAPTLHNGDAIFVEMISTYMTSYDPGDIVTIHATGMEGYDKEEKLIKRIIAGPNDTVSIRDGAVYVNDVLLDEPYLIEGVPTYCNEDSKTKGYDNLTLKEGEYYVLGDNRGASLDSRIIGPIPVDRIKAHVIAKIFPFTDLKVFQ